MRFVAADDVLLLLLLLLLRAFFTQATMHFGKQNDTAQLRLAFFSVYTPFSGEGQERQDDYSC